MKKLKVGILSTGNIPGLMALMRNWHVKLP